MWLGNTIVHESVLSLAKCLTVDGKDLASNEGSELEDRFATWRQGVQKISLIFDWYCHESVSQSDTYHGTVVVYKGRRTKRKEERRAVWDMKGGAYIAGPIGLGYFRAPRYMMEGAALMSACENGTDNAEIIGVEDAAPEYYSSRSCRMYDARDI